MSSAIDPNAYAYLKRARRKLVKVVKVTNPINVFAVGNAYCMVKLQEWSTALEIRVLLKSTRTYRDNVIMYTTSN